MSTGTNNSVIKLFLQNQNFLINSNYLPYLPILICILKVQIFPEGCDRMKHRKNVRAKSLKNNADS